MESRLFGLALAAAVLFGVAWVFVSFMPVGTFSTGIAEITNFDECAAAGNPVMESYPRQCNTPDGGHFVEDIGEPLEDDIFSFDANGCKRAGCSAQLCVPEGYGDIGTTCEYRPEYLCYAWSRCERQRDGTCGWTQTPEFQQCLANPASGDWMPQPI